MTRDEAITLVQTLVSAVNSHDLSALLAMYADGAVTYSPVAGQITGIAAIREWWQTIFALFPDWTVDVSDVLVDGDRIAFLGSAAATDRNGWFGQPATGERFEYRSMIILTLAQGKIVRDERVYDLSGVLQRLEKARLDKELNVAAEIQRTLLSQTCRSTPFCNVAGQSLPCRAIGGDFFESIQLPTGDLGIALGDVAGKGPSAALLAAMIHGMLAVQLESECSPRMTMSHLNRLLTARHVEPRFATLAYATISEAGQFVCSSAGHCPPVVLTDAGISRPKTGGPVLGLFADSAFEQESLRLSEGDTVILFSDGLIEARDSQDNEFGEERLLACLAACRTAPISNVIKRVLSTVDQFRGNAPRTDDMTVLIARFGRTAGKHPE